MSLWHTFLYQPLVNTLFFFYEALGENLGLAIIVATIAIRLALIPLTAPGMKSAQKLQALKPELDKLKEKHKDDKQALAQAQMALYKEHGVNPVGGILPMIIQIVVLIALFQAFNSALDPAKTSMAQLNEILYPALRLPADATLNTRFLYLDVSKPDVFSLPQALDLGLFKIDKLPGLFLIAAAAVQFFSSKLMMPVRPKPEPKKEQKEEGAEEMMASMQTQMMYLAPLMTLFIGLNFPAGLVLYWFTFSAVMIIQQLWAKRKSTGTSITTTK